MSAEPELIIRRVRIPTLGPGNHDVALGGGKILAIQHKIAVGAGMEIDGSDKILLPGWVDAHVHLNEPGRTSWEGIHTGTRALAAGGTTCFCDMPLNSSPPCTTPDAVEAKRALMKKKSLIDFGIWGGLIPANAGAMRDLARAGVVAVKAFLCPSGLDEFPTADEKTLLRGAAGCARAGLLLGVHAEDPAVVAGATRIAEDSGADEVDKFLMSRPTAAEEQAISLCIRTAEQTGCRIHVVHVSTPAGLRAIAEAARRGVRITAETCPHYLLLDPSLLRSLGAVAKCAPPLRSPEIRRKLWRALLRGEIQTIGSDHSPSLPSMKSGPRLVSCWGGISGAQHGALLFLQAMRERRAPWQQISTLLSARPADIFGIRAKGILATGRDADVVLLRAVEPRAIDAAGLFTRHRLSPYAGMDLRWEIWSTLVRGRIVYKSTPEATFAKSGEAVEVHRETKKL